MLAFFLINSFFGRSLFHVFFILILYHCWYDQEYIERGLVPFYFYFNRVPSSPSYFMFSRFLQHSQWIFNGYTYFISNWSIFQIDILCKCSFPQKKNHKYHLLYKLFYKQPFCKQLALGTYVAEQFLGLNHI